MGKYIFGYGSLLSASSRSRTLLEEVPITPVLLHGYRRVWNVRADQLGGGISFLGLEPNPESKCNGILFEVNESQFERLVARESGYQQITLPLDSFEMQQQTGKPAVQEVTTFCYQSDHRPSDAYPIVQSYLDLCLEGCLELENRFERFEKGQVCKAFLELTEGWSKSWINDRLYARRPWVHTPLAEQIDQAIKEHLPQYLAHITIQP